ncbi:ATP-binding cassette domain-containing protein [Parabacteroides sp. Marseille-P3160]|mgnify:CR=1 FL=1|uniref:ABC transporter ATP-binding protein n=1 Tax=Parabacteroides sp. Marseille-P3160 TaxID=1917887 RepID=UPI0009B9B246|nr:ATP-binding cassette domain-containing protein [Parabacteroides sp. Marseille-P3160]
MIKLEEVSFGYKKKKQILHDFSLSLEKGKIYGLLGKNGAGKSTLLYLLVGLLAARKGKVLFSGEDVSKRLPSVLKEMFIVPEEIDFPRVSLKRYIECNAPFYPKFSRESLDKYLQDFDLDLDLQLDALSMGEKKKVYMSFALATNTSLLLMDEPTNGLDIPAKSQFRKFIVSGMSDDKIILISTHQVRDVDKLLEQVIILDESRILLNQTVERICEKLYFTETNDKPEKDVLYSMPSLQGNSLILPNRQQKETVLNLESLFNAVLSEREKITGLFN